MSYIASVFLAIFLGNIVLWNFVRAHGTPISIRSILDAFDDLGLQALPFFQKFIDAFGVGLFDIG